MASTYEKIATTTVSGSSTATVTFSSISNAYTDLVLIMQVADTAANANADILINSDATSNYSKTQLYGNGTTAASNRNTNLSSLGITPLIGTSTNFATNMIIQFMNYSNTTTYKTILYRGNQASDGVVTFAGLWRSTSAINRLDINDTSAFWKAGSTFTLYGIKAA
jgi:hypothetical protein